jgi:hypothetical protein
MRLTKEKRDGCHCPEQVHGKQETKRKRHPEEFRTIQRNRETDCEHETESEKKRLDVSIRSGRYRDANLGIKNTRHRDEVYTRQT